MDQSLILIVEYRGKSLHGEWSYKTDKDRIATS